MENLILMVASNIKIEKKKNIININFKYFKKTC